MFAVGLAKLRLIAICLVLVAPAFCADYPRTPALGSTYVPIESWVYLAIDRLAALGYVQTNIAGLRPWTRIECARLLEEAGDLLQKDATASEDFNSLYDSLHNEFAAEFSVLEGQRNRRAELESIYLRSLLISGTPLTDGYHFGQTIINDYGRPFAEGENLQTGFSANAVSGPFSFYVRGEYQHAPSLPALSVPLRQLIANLDSNPLQPAIATSETNRFALLDTYIGVNLFNFNVTFGKQSLWWGPTRSGPFLFSNNAEPIYMMKVDRVTPFKLPWILRYFGPIRTQFFIGKLSEHQFPAHPWIHGAKFSFKPLPNLEFGFSRTVVFAGEGHPFTTSTFFRSIFSTSPSNTPRDDPGDRRSGFDLKYRIPGLRKWLTLYTDSMVDDDPLPLGAPGRSALNPGIYLSRVPGVPRLDLRVEAVYTNVPAAGGRPGQFVYYNVVYHDAYLNKGNLIGNWIGRDGSGLQLWSTYWWKPQNTIQVSYRNSRVNPKFIPGGGTLTDVAGRTDWKLCQNLGLSALLQYERWRYPVLSANIEHNFALSIQVNYHPRLWPAKP